ncbi:BSD domain [Popillia japonica]|uniref:BSD domain n=1 Tax=Popillia japonica TaxID=7064 RepID=A0AAW1JKA0_POPJA
MAEKNEDNGSWFGSWISAAKVKSTEVLEFVKKDLGEFGQAIKSEATNVVSSTGSVLEKTLGLNEPDSTANSMKRTFSSFIGQMNEALNPSPDDSDTEAILITDGEIITLSKVQQAVYELQKNDATFLTDPEVSLQKRYQCWLEIIDDQLSEQKLNKHLSGSTTLNEKYIKLVPDSVSHALFWKRYLFKKALVEDDIAMQEAMERREIKEKQMTEDDLKWEQELTEEEQIRLLEQYELETKQKSTEKQQKSASLADEILVAQSPTKTKTSPINNKDSCRDIIEAERKESQENNKNTTPIRAKESLMSTGTSSNSSTDDDWEKINEVDK